MSVVSPDAPPVFFGHLNAAPHKMSALIAPARNIHMEKSNRLQPDEANRVGEALEPSGRLR